MNRRLIAAVLIAGALASVLGCSRDVKGMFQTNPHMRERVLDVVSTDSTLSGPLMDRMMQADSTQGFMVRRVLSNPRTVQALMLHMASDRTMVDGILNVAVQDSGMRDHVVTLIDGMRMVRAKR